MANDSSDDNSGTLSVTDLQDWLKTEIRDSDKAHALRVKEATEFVTAYETGHLTAEQTTQRLYQYDRRWGEALYGATASPGLSDQAILSKIDLAREEDLYPKGRTHSQKVNAGAKPKSKPSL